MSKISLKNILKKTFNKKSKKFKLKETRKKVSKKKPKKLNQKKAKKITKTKIRKIPKILEKKKLEAKSDNLRISKSNEVKPEIKKIKKQETEKKEYKIKDYVIYPKHGVGQITEFKKINISSSQLRKI